MAGIFWNLKMWVTPEPKTKDGTSLAELHIHHIRDAHDVIGLLPESYTPISLVPNSAVSRLCGFPCCWVSIPHGFTAIVTRFGSDVRGTEEKAGWEPGFHCFMPCNRVARLVTEQFMVFDTPVRQCKTSDNVTVNIDVLITFSVTNAHAFCFGIGPEKFDDLLRASQEEVVRQMAGEIEVRDIYDLFGGSKTDPYVKLMNEKFDEFGVEVHSFTIRDVKIPPSMAQDFEDLTLYTSRTVEAEMKQESDKMRLNNDEELQKCREENDNRRMATEEMALTSQAEIRKEVQEVLAQLSKTVMLKGGERTAQVTDIETNSNLTISHVKAETSFLQTEGRLQMETKITKFDADTEAYEKNNESQGKLLAAEKMSEGMKAVAVEEGDAVEAFRARRQQEQDLAQISILDKLADNKRIRLVTSLENNTGLAPNNSLVAQITQQGMEAVRMKLAQSTSMSASSLNMGKTMAGGLVRPVPQQEMMEDC